MNINFDADNHIYYTDAGEIIPGVSEILRSCDGFWIPQSEPHRQDGHKKHSILYDYNEYGEMFIPANPDEAWIIKIWKEVKEKYGLRILNCERRVGHPVWMYGGTYDVLCEIIATGELILIDFKTGRGVNNDYVILQLSGYVLAANTMITELLGKKEKRKIDRIAVLVINPLVNKQGYRYKELELNIKSFEHLLWEYKRGAVPFEGLKNIYADMPF